MSQLIALPSFHNFVLYMLIHPYFRSQKWYSAAFVVPDFADDGLSQNERQGTSEQTTPRSRREPHQVQTSNRGVAFIASFDLLAHS